MDRPHDGETPLAGGWPAGLAVGGRAEAARARPSGNRRRPHSGLPGRSARDLGCGPRGPRGVRVICARRQRPEELLGTGPARQPSGGARHSAAPPALGALFTRHPSLCARGVFLRRAVFIRAPGWRSTNPRRRVLPRAATRASGCPSLNARLPNQTSLRGRASAPRCESRSPRVTRESLSARTMCPLRAARAQKRYGTTRRPPGEPSGKGSRAVMNASRFFLGVRMPFPALSRSSLLSVPK